MSKKISIKTLKRLAAESGLSLMGHTDISPHIHAAAQLSTWQDKGFAAEMKYMLRPASLLAHPLNLLPEGKSLIIFSLLYSRRPTEPLPKGFGRVARYAWGEDYHAILKTKLTSLALKTEKEINSKFKWRIFSDSVPLLERAFAERAGLGFIGKNTLLIKPKVGSLFFISEIISELEIEEEKGGLNVIKEDTGCKSCTNCIDACPTGAISEPYSVDAGKCISYLTIEKRGPLTDWEQSALGSWIFGCDICQEVCPFNHSSLKEGVGADFPEFEADYGVGQKLNLNEILSIKTPEQFKTIFSKTALLRTGRDGLLRNAAAVSVNTESLDTIPALCVCATEDASFTVRASAVSALKRFSKIVDGNYKNMINEVLRKDKTTELHMMEDKC